LIGEIVYDLRFLDVNDQLKMTLCPTEFVLKVTTLNEELEEASESHEDRFSKTLFILSQCKIVEVNSFGDPLSRSQMHVNKWDEVALAE
jgi:hypothetical protein